MSRYTDSIDEMALIERAIASVDLDRAAEKYDFVKLATEIAESCSGKEIDILIWQFEGAYLAGYLRDADWYLDNPTSLKCAYQVCTEINLPPLMWGQTVHEYLLSCYHFGTEDAKQDEELKDLQKRG